MSGGEGRHLSNQDLQMVQDLIEHCLQLYMTRKEAVSFLSRRANVMPSITELLWQRLEEENQEFFEVYHIRLALKEQIQQFNELLKQQANMEKIQNTRVAPMPVSNESCEAQFQQNAGCYAIDQTRLSITADTLLAQNSNSMRLMHGLNGGIVASESGYPSDSTIFYDNDLNLGEVHTSMGASIATYTGIGTSSQQLNETLGVNGSFGQFGENPKVFNIPDLVNYSVHATYNLTTIAETENYHA
ncbi:unnamed protein product [Amaranthus hypochondriacus]